MNGKDLTERVYKAFKKDLMLGYIPSGELFSEQMLAERYNCSRTPAREAAGRLVADGFLNKYPSKGYIVNLPTRQEMKEMRFCRWILESEALQLVLHCSYKEDLKDMYELMDALEKQEESKAFLEMIFHFELANLSGNRTLAQMIKLLNEKMVRGETQAPESTYTYEFLKEPQKNPVMHTVYSAENHRQIISALLDGSLKDARRALWQDIYPESKWVEGN